MNRSIRKYILFGGIITLWIILYFGFGLRGKLNFAYIQQNAKVFRSTVESAPLIWGLVYILVYIGVTSVSIPGATLLTLLGGFLFGTVISVILIDVGATIGAFLAFLSARFLFRDSLEKKYGKKVKKFNKKLLENGNSYLLALRLIPVFPFFVVNLLSGLTRAKKISFIWTTAVGILPASIAYAYAGTRLAHIKSTSDLLSGGMLLAFTLIGLLTLAPVLIKYLFKKSL
jgi:uncharacterized membrane protein YdjX (TVP38/TMEM64 family)